MKLALFVLANDSHLLWQFSVAGEKDLIDPAALLVDLLLDEPEIDSVRSDDAIVGTADTAATIFATR